MRQIDISPLAPSRFADLIGPQRWAAFEEAALAARTVLGDRIMWNVNATAQGGGVAEMLQILLAYGQGAGTDTRWLVLDGESEFFATTKRLHNVLHGMPGDGGDFGPAERANYEEVLARNLETTEGVVRPGDVVILHDPQTAGLIPGYRGLGAHVVWRSHIGRDVPNEHTARGWAFLEPYLSEAEGVIVTRVGYAPPSVPAEKIVIIAPSIDPFSTKNAELSPDMVRDSLIRVRLLAGEDHHNTLTFHRRDGAHGHVEARTGLLVEGGVLPPDARIILQVSRWDRLKDMPGVMRGFTEHLDVPDDAHLVLCGPAVEGVTDDPEGAEVLEECREVWRGLSPEMRDRVHLVCVPMDDLDENAHIVNALQRHAYAVVQKSLFEGFGLTVTEAMWKARPVIASAIGGIQDQIVDGRDGLLLPDPTNLADLGAAMGKLLASPQMAATLGAAAKQRVLTDFVGDRHLMQYGSLLKALLS
ncbi:MAG TPA: glycosyltransferase [Dermatophilaceae bacterium]|nr:glycosyltransferase [Dermatophilaceae bacterium]